MSPSRLLTTSEGGPRRLCEAFSASCLLVLRLDQDVDATENLFGEGVPAALQAFENRLRRRDFRERAAAEEWYHDTFVQMPAASSGLRLHQETVATPLRDDFLSLLSPV